MPCWYHLESVPVSIQGSTKDLQASYSTWGRVMFRVRVRVTVVVTTSCGWTSGIVVEHGTVGH